MIYWPDRSRWNTGPVYDICGETGEFLFISMLMEDCLERGKGICGGGIRYLGGTLETYGNINTANSLYAIKDLVYDRKLISAKKLMEAMNGREGFCWRRRNTVTI